jgi:hypothetical protein
VQTYEFHLWAWWPLPLFTRNPLVRRSDRLGAAAILIAILICLPAVAFAGAVGTAVYDSHHHRYVNEAQTRHRVTAVVVDNSAASDQPDTGAGTVRAAWRVDGVDHAGRLRWADPVSVGGRIEIWVDQNGDEVAAPTPTWRAGADAVVVGYTLLGGVVITTVSLLTFVFERLARVRDVQWDQAIDRLADSSWQ